jgi:hypothetical protein
MPLDLGRVKQELAAARPIGGEDLDHVLDGGVVRESLVESDFEPIGSRQADVLTPEKP